MLFCNEVIFGKWGHFWEPVYPVESIDSFGKWGYFWTEKKFLNNDPMKEDEIKSCNIFAISSMDTCEKLEDF